jgi:SpoVK/Ycf46/Vps4 family AAA+-type ATPase
MKGIFIATTNLISNIDGAFDRRLLFKQKFELPNEGTRAKILKVQFPDLNEGLLLKISRDYELSGGQIQNIKKKFMADEILFGEIPVTEEGIMAYITNEVGFRTGKQIIGFDKK